MNRWSASVLHLAISFLLACLFLALLRWVWFPGPLFEVSGAVGLLTILVPADVVLGPLLTAIVFNPGKPMLKLDLTLIALVQVIGLLYGAWVIAEARPAYVVFFGNQLKVVRSHDIVEGKPWLAPLTGPEWVGIPSEGALDAEVSELMGGLSGAMPAVLNRQRYRPWKEIEPAFDMALRPLADFKPLVASELSAFLGAAGIHSDAILLLPITVRDTRMTAVFDSNSHQLQAIVPVATPAK